MTEKDRVHTRKLFGQNRKARSRSHHTLKLFLIVGISIALAACGGQKELSERPPRSSQATTFDTRPSTIGAMVSVSMSDIQGLINEKIPKTFTDGGNGEDVCGSGVLKKVCVGTKYDFTATRGTGPIAVSALSADTIRIALPISFSGKGGFRGDGAKKLGLQAKNFEGGLFVNADLKATLTPEWCPQLDANVTYSWTTPPRVEIVKKVYVTVQTKVEEKLKEKLPELVNSAKSAINCQHFRSNIAKIYGSQTLAFELKDKSKLHVNIDPLGIGFSGVQIDSKFLRLAATMTANVEISGVPLIPSLKPLPVLTTVPISTPEMTLALPFRVPYEILTEQLRAMVNEQAYSHETVAGKIVVTINDVEIYPSGNRIVVGVNLNADFPSSALDTKGSVYLIGTPVIERGTTMSLPDLAFTRILDNDFWNAATVVLEDPIRKAIRKAASHDLTADITDAKEKLDHALKDPNNLPELEVTLDNVSMALGRVAVAEKELSAEALFMANASIVAKQLSPPK